MNLCIRARGTTVAWANIKMYPIYKIQVHVHSALNAGRVSALVTLVGNEFQEEMVLGTNQCKNSWCEQMVEKTHYIERHLLGRGTKTDEGEEMRLCTILNIVQSL